MTNAEGLKYQKDEFVFLIFRTPLRQNRLWAASVVVNINGFAFKVLSIGLSFRKRESARSGVGNTEGSVTVISIIRLGSVDSRHQCPIRDL